eukprot:TRINITY_DN1953_c0_g5_i1.p1 TRINITY_DN1953_c0_g5~~TRINITY_DN1953_c0_g5_i1.p1  ORF type:complete len:518 (-),score=124.56 TRINITY_DN1953_c0_g5_i1:29-1582(-)
MGNRQTMETVPSVNVEKKYFVIEEMDNHPYSFRKYSLMKYYHDKELQKLWKQYLDDPSPTPPPPFPPSHCIDTPPNNRLYDRAIGSFFGMPVGDALGAPLEFSHFKYNVKKGDADYLSGFDRRFWFENHHYNRFQLKPGQWTDDSSMGFCVAESLLAKKKFDGKDMRLRFYYWWKCEYCNAFGFDKNRSSHESVGLGGNISLSMGEFHTSKNKEEATRAGDKNTSGNGSIMRNAAIPLFFRNNKQEAIKAAILQSRTTHQGVEAEQCCALLTYIVLSAMEGDGTPTFLAHLDHSIIESLIPFNDKLLPSVKNLIMSNPESDFNWKNSNFQYNSNRARSQPGYVGSYAMDAMAMALHCVFTTTSFKKAMLKCANIRGDSDSVCAVAGQIAGAVYGFTQIPKTWVHTVLEWDPEFWIPKRAHCLFYSDELANKIEECVQQQQEPMDVEPTEEIGTQIQTQPQPQKEAPLQSQPQQEQTSQPQQQQQPQQQHIEENPKPEEEAQPQQPEGDSEPGKTTSL